MRPREILYLGIDPAIQGLDRYARAAPDPNNGEITPTDNAVDGPDADSQHLGCLGWSDKDTLHRNQAGLLIRIRFRRSTPAANRSLDIL